MTLTERIAAAIQDKKRLRSVPPAVIEDVLAAGIDWLSDHVPACTRACELSGMEFEACEACGHLIDPEVPEGAKVDSEGIWVCAACAVDGGPAAPAPVKEDGHGE